MASIIEVNNLTKDYGEGRGIFDVSLHVAQGECFGFLGPNGAGKTTTIRHLMGFLSADSGAAEIFGQNCRLHSAKLMNKIGYLPGEVALPEGMSAKGYLQFMHNLRNEGKNDRCDELVERFELKTDVRIRSMSIGDRRKLAVVVAFMHDPEVLILDEPTSGLDPIMQDEFIAFVKEEKNRGKSILLSSHFFNEVAAVCDRISVIKKGKIAAEFGKEEIGDIDSEYQGSLLSAVLKNPPQEATSVTFESPAIKVENLTKDYGKQRGVFGLNFEVGKGEVVGFVGTNGSGKTTTIRTMMGFVNPDSGAVIINGRDSIKDSTELKSDIAYIPGEIQFPTFRSADAFFDYQAKYFGLKDKVRRNELISDLKLDSSVNPRKMSKGMKQKTAIVASLMDEKEILILDEPTTGLDPIMRESFIELIKSEKARGKTVFMSSHIFEEIEEVCDRVVIIHDGKIVAILSIDELEKYRSGTQDEKRAELEKRFEEIFRKED